MNAEGKLQPHPLEAKGEKPQDIEDEHEELSQHSSEEEEKVRIMGQDQYYSEDYVEKEIQDSEISRRFSLFHSCFGQDSFRRYNLHYLDDDTIIYASGVTMQILNLKTMERRTLFSKDVGGVGSIAVHPSKKFYAVAQKGQGPLIYIYSYPDLQLYRVLRKGTERAYSHVTFSGDGTQLASVGSAPDYMLTVWDWKSEKVILRAKAFSQDIFRVAFSPYVEGQLITSGTGHIRFWKMASTFTGLKLQGDIGKFGQLELSDVSGFAELPDGKVLCGTEYGTLLLWEGNLVKAQLVGEGEEDTPLHQGMIEVVLLEGGTAQAPEVVLTAGADGFIRTWDFFEIDNAESDETPNVVISLKKEQRVVASNGEPAYIVDLVKGNDHWLVQDGKGRLFKMQMSSGEVKELTHFHSGPLRGVAVPRSADVSVTLGNDGRVKLWDFITRKEVSVRDFEGEGRCLDYMPFKMSNKDRVFACGFANGLVRVIALAAQDSFTLLHASKPHDAPVQFIKYSPDSSMLMSVAQDSSFFFQHLPKPESDVQAYEPLCLFFLKNEEGKAQKITDVCWHRESKKILVATMSGIMYEITAPVPSEIDNQETFQVDLPVRTWTVKMMEFQMKKFQKTQEQEKEEARQRRMAKLRGEEVDEPEEEEKEWDPAPILAARYLQMSWAKKGANDEFVISVEGPYAGLLYVCQFEKERPLKTIKSAPDTKTIYIDESPSGDFLVTGCSNGSFQVRVKATATTINDLSQWMELRPHDTNTGRIAGIAFTHDERFVLSAGHDGVLFCHEVDKNGTVESTKPGQKNRAPEFQSAKPVGRMLENLNLEKQKLTLTRAADKDVENPEQQLSIQEQKLRTEQDNRLNEANTQKQKMKAKVAQLRQDFLKLLERNAKQPQHLRLPDDFFEVDQEYFDVLQEKHQDRVQEVEKEVAWQREWHRIHLQKLEDVYYNCLMYKRFAVKALKGKEFVHTLRLEYMSEFLNENLNNVRRLLENDAAQANQYLQEGEQGASLEGAGGGIMSESESNRGNETAAQGEGQVDQTQTIQGATGGTFGMQRAGIGQQTGQKKKSAAEIKREERKLAREQRKIEMEKLEKEDPSKNEANPEDKRAIENAKKSYGDYKLKSAENYIVPEKQRVNCAKKRQQMFILESSIHSLKEQFNEKVVGLRDKKRGLMEDIKEKNERIAEINDQLGIHQDLFTPMLDMDLEEPDYFLEVSDQDLIHFVRDRAAKLKEKAASKNLFGGSKKKGDDDEDQIMLRRVFGEEMASGRMQENENLREETEEKEEVQPVERFNKRVMDTGLEDEMADLERIMAEFEKNELMSEMEKNIKEFDGQIKELANERLKLLSDLKNAEMKLIQYYQELLLLHGMESRDQDLSSRLVRCMTDKGQIVKEIMEISKKLRDKKGEIESIENLKEANMAKFKELIPETTPNYDEVFAFFTKKVKRRRKQERRKKNEDDDEDDEGDDEFDEDEDYEDEGEDEDEEDEEDNEQALKFNQEEHKIDDVDRLREERLDIIEEGQKIQKILDELDQQRKLCENRQKEVDKRLKDTLDEIHVFQRDKMRRLNQIEVCVVLALDQIQNLEPNQLRLEYWKEERAKELQNRLQQRKLPGGSRAESRSQHGDSVSQVTSMSVSRTGHGMEGQSSFQMDQERDDRGHFLPTDLQGSILFTQSGINELLGRINELNEEIKQFMEYHRELRFKKGETSKSIKKKREDRKVREEKYKENQMLRFGDFKEIDALETQGPSQTVRDLTAKFGKTEKKCIKMVEEAEAHLEKTKQELSQAIQSNTTLLSLLTDLGRQNLSLNKKLDSTNKKIFVDDDVRNRESARKYQEETKQLLELQQREIDTLKAEILLFKRKGGHIYTTVTTNRRVATYAQPQGDAGTGDAAYGMVPPMDDSQALNPQMQ